MLLLRLDVARTSGAPLAVPTLAAKSIQACDVISKSPVPLLLGLAMFAALSAASRLDTNDLEMESTPSQGLDGLI